MRTSCRRSVTDLVSSAQALILHVDFTDNGEQDVVLFFFLLLKESKCSDYLLGGEYGSVRYDAAGLCC